SFPTRRSSDLNAGTEDLPTDLVVESAGAREIVIRENHSAEMTEDLLTNTATAKAENRLVLKKKDRTGTAAIEIAANLLAATIEKAPENLTIVAANLPIAVVERSSPNTKMNLNFQATENSVLLNLLLREMPKKMGYFASIATSPMPGYVHDAKRTN